MKAGYKGLCWKRAEKTMIMKICLLAVAALLMRQDDKLCKN